MKLPGTLDFGVQSLGRPDKGAMRAKYGAEQQAALAWGTALATAGNEVAKIATAEGMADANLTLSERVAMDKKSTAELDAYLANTMAIDMDDDDVPAAVRKAAEMAGHEGGMVNTYEIAVEASKQHFEASRQASAAAIGEQMASDKALASYNNQMDTAWARSAQGAVKTHVIQRIQHLSARADVMYNDALNSLDEEAMTKIVIDSERDGTWTPEYAANKFNAIGETIDHVRAERMYRDAKTQGEIDRADDFTDGSRVNDTTRIALGNRSIQMQDRQYNLSIREQGKNYGDAHAMLIRGELTKEDVAKMAESQQISGSHANTLINAMDTVKPEVSDQNTYNNLARAAIGLRFSSADMEPDSVRKRAQAVREDIQMAATGVMPGGNFKKPTITVEDFASLMDEVDEQENKALGKGGIEYGVAIKQLRQMTGYTDEIAKSLGGRHPSARAYTDMQTAMQDHMNANPGTANPLEWVAANSHRYTADKYDKLYGDTLADQFPDYRDDILYIVTGTARAAIKPELGFYTAPSPNALLNRARMDALNDDTDFGWSDFERLRRGLAYKYTGGAQLAKPESANE